MNTRQMKKRAAELHKEAQELYREAEVIEQNGLLPKFQYLKGMCFKLTDSCGKERWDIFYLVKEVTSVYKMKRTLSATLTCFSFSQRADGASFLFDDTQFHDMLKHLRAKEIGRHEFDEALESAYAKIQMAAE